jgi:hypothetical protein
MTKSISQNPLRGFWDEVASGGTPSTADLEHENIPSRFHKHVREQVRIIHELRADGSFRAAREVAREAATQLLAALGDDWEPPSERSDPLPDDPRALAEIVARRERGHQ